MQKNWFEDVKKYYEAGLWSAEMVANAVKKGKITAEEYRMIIGGPRPVEVP